MKANRRISTGCVLHERRTRPGLLLPVSVAVFKTADLADVSAEIIGYTDAPLFQQILFRTICLFTRWLTTRLCPFPVIKDPF